jgi:hypothetical protein
MISPNTKTASVTVAKPSTEAAMSSKPGKARSLPSHGKGISMTAEPIARKTIRVQRCDDLAGSPPITLRGREKWALEKLIDAGNAGCTPITTPGPRWSHYVFKLRGYGFAIETIHEPHGGPFPGHHARYVLRSEVQILDEAA